MSHPVIYQGDLQELLREYKDKWVMDGECAKLPQFFTNVGWTGRWQPGPRVVDVPHVLPGTVIANFKFKDGRLKYPNEHHYHAGLFYRAFTKLQYSGVVAPFSMIDQWQGNHPKSISERAMLAYPPEVAKKNHIWPCDNASDFYIVLVP